MTDREKLVEIAKLHHHLEELRAQQAATMARMIRGCLDKIEMDPATYNLRGHESYRRRSEIVKENRRDQKLAKLYLIALATSLEDQALRLPESLPSIEGKDDALRTTQLSLSRN